MWDQVWGSLAYFQALLTSPPSATIVRPRRSHDFLSLLLCLVFFYFIYRILQSKSDNHVHSLWLKHCLEIQKKNHQDIDNETGCVDRVHPPRLHCAVQPWGKRCRENTVVLDSSAETSAPDQRRGTIVTARNTMPYIGRITTCFAPFKRFTCTLCSGVLIASQWFLAAAHCVAIPTLVYLFFSYKFTPVSFQLFKSSFNWLYVLRCFIFG
jgi:hypothetical protein